MSSSSSPPNTTPERRRSGGGNRSHADVATTTLRDVDIVTPAKNGCDSVNNEEENLTEIKDLQRALEYLISDKRQSNNVTGVDADAEDEALCQIPNLVNRILVEHYSSLPPSQSHKRRDISYSAREKMTQLIIAVIVEFAEPYFVRITKHKEEERLKLLMHDKETESQKKKSKKRKGVEENNVLSSKLRFEDRAVSWATQCLKLLLQPRSLLPSIGGVQKNSSSSNCEANAPDDLHIPELEAFLSATGSNDGHEIEQRMQQSLLLGIQARSMFMSSYLEGTRPKYIREMSQR